MSKSVLDWDEEAPTDGNTKVNEYTDIYELNLYRLDLNNNEYHFESSYFVKEDDAAATGGRLIGIYVTQYSVDRIRLWHCAQ